LLFRFNPNSTPLKTAQIIVVSDSFVIQQGLKAIAQANFIPENPPLIVTSVEFLNQVIEFPASIILLHSHVGNSYLIEEISSILQSFPESQVAAVVHENDNATIELILKNNLPVCLHIQANTQEWATACAAVSDGSRYYSNKILHHALEHKYNSESTLIQSSALTSRQTEILKKITLGLDNNEIGSQLNLSPHTVQTHRKNMMKKLGVSSLSGLIIHAIKIGLVSSDQLNSK